MRAFLAGLGLVWVGVSAQALPPVQIGIEWTGPTYDQSRFIPPDSQGAASDERVAVFVNGRYTVYRKSDGAPLATSTLNDFWSDAGATPGHSFDPRVLFDPTSGRWFAAGAADSNSADSAWLVAVSNTDDPLDGWAGFRIDADSTDKVWADFPMLGLDAEGLYVASPMFPVDGPDLPTSNSFLVLPKADLLAPTPGIAGATIFERESLGLGGFQPEPVTNLDGGGPPEKFYAGTLTFLGQIQGSQIDGPITAPSYSGGTFIPIDALSEPPNAEQPGPKVNLDSGDSRFGSSIVRQNGIDWAVQSVGVDGRAAVRWIQIDSANDIVLDWGLITDPELDLIYPSIAVNEFDQIVVGMSGSSESQFPSAYAVVGEKQGGVTSFGDLLLIAQGNADYERGNPRNRWGDYSATVLDPSDPRSFWTFQEFAIAENTWAVRVTQLLLVPEPGTALLLAGGLLVIARRRRV